MSPTAATTGSTLAVVVLTRDEEVNLPVCLASLKGVSDSIFVVDSGSRDRTVQIAQQYGAQVLEHPFASHARQWRWALDQLPATIEWVLGLDADQSLSDELHGELIELFGPGEDRLSTFDGFYLNRRQIFRGRWIRHGGYYPKYLLKLFRVRRVQLDERELVDHHFYVRGSTGRLGGDLIEDNRNEARINFWVSKHVQYSELHAREELARRRKTMPWLMRPRLRGTPDQRIMWLKLLWYRLPLYVRPFIYFFYRYVLRLGFLDGKQGFIFHFLQAFWYRLLVDINLDELLQDP